MRRNLKLPLHSAMACLLVALSSATAPADVVSVFAQSGPFELYTRPQEIFVTPHLIATVVGVRAKNPGDTVEGIRLLSIRGDVHQTWFEDYRENFGHLAPTVFREVMDAFHPDFPEVPHMGVGDTHLIPACEWTGECEVSGTIVEENDLSNPFQFGHYFFGTLDGQWDDYFTVYGFGDLEMPTSGDALDFAASGRSPQVDLAYIVTNAAAPGRPQGRVTLTLEVYGRHGVFGPPLTTTGQFGLGPEGPLPVAFVPEPPTWTTSIAAIALLAASQARRRCRRNFRPLARQ
jgi:hypothetical protein